MQDTAELVVPFPGYPAGGGGEGETPGGFEGLEVFVGLEEGAEGEGVQEAEGEEEEKEEGGGDGGGGGGHGGWLVVEARRGVVVGGTLGSR